MSQFFSAGPPRNASSYSHSSSQPPQSHHHQPYQTTNLAANIPGNAPYYPSPNNYAGQSNAGLKEYGLRTGNGNLNAHPAGFNSYMPTGNPHMNNSTNHLHGSASSTPGMSNCMGEQYGLRMGWLAAFGTEGYEGEPPLLEELGTLAVLNPFRQVDQHLMDDTDLAGPLLFAALFAFFLRTSGKVHFGYIYGLSVLGSTSLHIILSLMSPIPWSNGPTDGNMSIPGQSGGGVPTNGNSTSSGKAPSGNNVSGINSNSTSRTHSRRLGTSLTYVRSASILGYCMLPLVLTSAAGVIVRTDGPIGWAFTILAIAWCTHSASGLFCAAARMPPHMRALVAYPLGLFYLCFGIMAIFSSHVLLSPSSLATWFTSTTLTSGQLNMPSTTSTSTLPTSMPGNEHRGDPAFLSRDRVFNAHQHHLPPAEIH